MSYYTVLDSVKLKEDEEEYVFTVKPAKSGEDADTSQETSQDMTGKIVFNTLSCQQRPNIIKR